MALASCCQESPLGYPSVATWSSGQHYCRATPPARVARLGGFVRPRVVYLEIHYCGFHPHATESNPSHWKGRCQFILASAFPSVFNCIAALLQFHCAHEKLAVVALQQSFAASGALVIYILLQALYIITEAVSACHREILRKVTVESLLHPPSAAWREGANLQPSSLRPLGAGAAGLPRAHWLCHPLAQANGQAHLTRV